MKVQLGDFYISFSMYKLFIESVCTDVLLLVKVKQNIVLFVYWYFRDAISKKQKKTKTYRRHQE